MYENIQKYSCGGCGNDKYTIYRQEDNNSIIITECTECKSQTEIVITQPEIKLRWGHSGDGIMSIY